MENILGAIDRGLAVTGTIVGGVRADQWSLPTCCADWDVRAVTNHVVGGFTLLAGTLTNGRLDGDFDRDWLGSDPTTFIRLRRRRYQPPGTVPRRCRIRSPSPSERCRHHLAAVIHLTEVVVHGSDIAVATGAQHLIDEELCAELLTTMHRVGIDNFRVPGIFGPAVPVTQQVPPHLQLMAYLGRTVLPTSSLVDTNS
jgi:uncharacterized protein (TIGR03086 family)